MNRLLCSAWIHNEMHLCETLADSSDRVAWDLDGHPVNSSRPEMRPSLECTSTSHVGKRSATVEYECFTEMHYGRKDCSGIAASVEGQVRAMGKVPRFEVRGASSPPASLQPALEAGVWTASAGLNMP